MSGTSSATVATNLMDSEFIDLLRTRSILGGLGVRFLPGLVGNVAIPKMTAGATGYWVTEASAITGSEPTLGQVTGTPHTAGVMVDISRLLLNQSTPAAEMITRDELIERLARTIQIAVFAGTGSDGQPKRDYHGNRHQLPKRHAGHADNGRNPRFSRSDLCGQRCWSNDEMGL